MQLIARKNRRAALRRSGAAGDTLIEVLFAFAVLSLVIIGALTIMNQGTVAAQRSLETTLVRQEIDGQAETLRFLHDAYVANYRPGVTYPVTTPSGQWVTMAANVTATSVTSLEDLTSCPATHPSNSFILDPVTAKYQGANQKLVQSQTFAQLAYNSSGAFTASQGIWIEAVRSPSTTDPNKQNARFIDFHIYACWDAPGNGPPMTIGTIVRLYEPRG